jgi:hypothetical protein
MIDLRDFVELATDNIFECNVYDLNTEEVIFDGMLADIPDEYLDCELCSWDTATGEKITFNIEAE